MTLTRIRPRARWWIRGGVVVPMRRRGVYGSGQVVEELPEGALERAAAQVVEGDMEDEVEGFGRRP